MANLIRKIVTMGHPYKMSVQRHAYEEIAETCGTTPDRVYALAHGAKRSRFEDDGIIAELLARGILYRR